MTDPSDARNCALRRPSSSSFAVSDHFTYFILPFGYRAQRSRESGDRQYLADELCGTDARLTDGPDGDGSSQKVRDRWEARQRYLVPEMRYVLFQRARWFRLFQPSAIGQMEPVTLVGSLIRGESTTPRQLKFLAGSPEVVLFEWNRAVSARGEDRLDPSCVGLRLLPAVLDGTQAPILGDLLDFNQALRYVRRPTFVDARSSLVLTTGVNQEPVRYSADQEE